MKVIPIVLLVSVFFATGCGSSHLEPAPTEAENTISVYIDSIPPGADVYAIDHDGQIGIKLGRTPFVHKSGVAPQYVVSTNTGERIMLSQVHAWGAGVQWRTVEGLREQSLFLNIALAKGSHSLAVASKELFQYRETIRNKKIALTVPLKTLAQVNREVEQRLQQQTRNSQQNVNIQYQKDGLDSVNSGLDALIKLNGLGALMR